MRWRVLALPLLESPSPFIPSEQIWRMRRLKRCPETMRGMPLHASSHKPIRSCPHLPLLSLSVPRTTQSNFFHSFLSSSTVQFSLFMSVLQSWSCEPQSFLWYEVNQFLKLLFVCNKRSQMVQETDYSGVTLWIMHGFVPVPLFAFITLTLTVFVSRKKERKNWWGMVM